MTNPFSCLPIKRGLDKLLTGKRDTKEYPESNTHGKVWSYIIYNIKAAVQICVNLING